MTDLHAAVNVQRDSYEVTCSKRKGTFDRERCFKKGVKRKFFNKKNKFLGYFLRNILSEKVTYNKLIQRDSTIEGCSKIWFKTDNLEIEAIITQIGEKEVIYKVCDDPASPSFIVPKRKIRRILNQHGFLVYGNKGIENADTAFTTADKKARLGLIIGALSIPLTFLFGLGLILGISAWAISNRALKLLKYQKIDYRKSGTIAKIGRALGMLTILLFIIAGLVILGVILPGIY